MHYLLVQYSYLQVLDFLTTVAFLANGIGEGNPFVRLIMNSAPNPFGGLLVAKALAVALGFYCWKLGKYTLLSRINVFFAIIVAWNIVALIIGPAV